MRHMHAADHTDSIVAEGRALVWAIEALNRIELSCPFERELAELFQAACKRCLRDIIAKVPSRVCMEILGAGEYIQDGQPVEWMDESEEQATTAPRALAPCPHDPGARRHRQQTSTGTDGTEKTHTVPI